MSDAGKNDGAQNKTDVLSDAAREGENKPLFKPPVEQKSETNVSNKTLFILC